MLNLVFFQKTETGKESGERVLVLWEEAKAESDLKSVFCLFGYEEATELLSRPLLCLYIGAQMFTTRGCWGIS